MAKRHRSNKPPVMTKQEFEMNLLLLGVHPHPQWAGVYQSNNVVWVDADTRWSYISVEVHGQMTKCPTYEMVIAKLTELM